MDFKAGQYIVLRTYFMTLQDAEYSFICLSCSKPMCQCLTAGPLSAGLLSARPLSFHEIK